MESSICSDITTSSNEKLAEKQVSFQGTEIAVNEITPAVSPLAKLLSLGALMEGKKLKISDFNLLQATLLYGQTTSSSSLQFDGTQIQTRKLVKVFD